MRRAPRHAATAEPADAQLDGALERAVMPGVPASACAVLHALQDPGPPVTVTRTRHRHFMYVELARRDDRASEAEALEPECMLHRSGA